MSHSNVPVTVSAAVAAAIALGSAGTAFGATTTFDSTSLGSVLAVSVERAANDVAANPSTVYSLPAITFQPDVNTYAVGHKIVLTVSGATVFSATDISTVTCSTGTNATAVMKWAFEGVSGNTVTLAVTERPAGNIVDPAAPTNPANKAACQIPAGGIKVLASSLTSPSQVTLGFVAQTSTGVVIDTLQESATARNPVVVGAALRNITATPCSSTERNPFTNALRGVGAVVGAPSTSGVCDRDGTPFDGIVLGTNFSGTGDAAHTDTLRWVVRNEEALAVASVASAAGVTVTTAAQAAGYLSNGAALDLASGGKVLVHTVNATAGDFSVVDDDANGCTLGDLTAGAGQMSISSFGRSIDPAVATNARNATIASISPDCKTVVINSNVLTDGTAQAPLDMPFELSVYLNGLAQNGFGVTGSGGVRTGRAITPSAFTLAVDLKATAADVTALSTIRPSAGSWTTPAVVSGTTVNIPYVPYGAGISRILYATNTSTTVPVNLAITARNSAGTLCSSSNFAAISLPAGGNVQISGQVDAGIRACFPNADANSEKFSVTISRTGTTSSGGSITVTSSYNVSGNRNFVYNSSN